MISLTVTHVHESPASARAYCADRLVEGRQSEVAQVGRRLSRLTIHAADGFQPVVETGEMTEPRIHIRPFADRLDCERMVDYFLNASEAFLAGMGVDPKKLPRREAWIEAALTDLCRADHEKDRSYLAWIYDGVPVGHSSINQIKVGEEAFIHLHLWVKHLREAGLGTQFFQASAAEFMRMFRLKRLFCEPYAGNPAPNRVVLKSGFRFVKKYRTTPGPINFEQEVNLYVMDGGQTHAG